MFKLNISVPLIHLPIALIALILQDKFDSESVKTLSLKSWA